MQNCMQFYWKQWQWLLAVATLGDTIQMEPILSMSHLPRLPRHVVNVAGRSRIARYFVDYFAPKFDNVNQLLRHINFWCKYVFLKAFYLPGGPIQMPEGSSEKKVKKIFHELLSLSLNTMRFHLSPDGSPHSGNRQVSLFKMFSLRASFYPEWA